MDRAGFDFRSCKTPPELLQVSTDDVRIDPDFEFDAPHYADIDLATGDLGESDL